MQLVQSTLEHASLLELLGCTIFVCLLGHDIIMVRLNDYKVITIRTNYTLFFVAFVRTARSVRNFVGLIGVGKSECYSYGLVFYSTHVNHVQHFYLLLHR